MKKLLFAALLLIQTQAFATKARVQALAYSGHLTDEQYIFSDALYANYLGNFISLESGVVLSDSTTTSSSNAEGMVGYKLDENRTLVLALGHQDDYVVGAREFANAFGTTYTMTQNPVHAFYGIKGEDISYAFGAFYSNFKDKLTSATESSSGITFGAEVGAWQYYGAYVLGNTVETAASNEFDGNGAWSLNTYYTGESIHAYLTINKGFAKSSTAGTENESHDNQTIYLGLLDTQQKDGNDTFWGAQIVTTTVSCHTTGSVACDQKYTSTVLPVWFGYEAQANSWLTLRGSITQTVLINQSKDELGYPAGALDFSTGAASELAAGENSTTVAAGVGLNFKNFTVDGTLSTASTQTLNTTDLMGQVGMKYTF